MLPDLLPRSSLVGRVLRWPLRSVRPDRPRRILGGPGAGLRWYPGSGPHGVWLGLYERSSLERLERVLGVGDVVWDVGAHAGLYSLVASRRGATVLAFEPLPENLAWLERNLRLNGLEHRVGVQPYALSDFSGRAGFARESTRMEGRLGPDGPEPVQVYRADELDLPAPTVLKVDVEGSEIDVLRGAAAIIAARRPAVLLEVHEPHRIEDCLAALPGYGAEEIEPRRFLCLPRPGMGR